MLDIILIIAAVIIVVVPIVIPVLMAIPMARATVTHIPDEISDSVRINASRAVDEAKVAALGFTYEGVYEVNLGVGRALFVMYRHGQDATYLATYTSNATQGNWITDIVSILSEQPHLAITTSVTKEGHSVPPRAGDHMQTFDNVGLNGLWQHHIDAEAYLTAEHGVVPGKVQMPGGQMLETYIRDSSRYRLVRPWVWLSMPYRYWIGRHLLHNRPIAKR